VILTSSRPEKFQILNLAISNCDYNEQSSREISNRDFGEKVAGKFLNLDFNWQSFSKNSNRPFCGLTAVKFLNIAFNGQSSGQNLNIAF
jgi:hypothetical protein